MNKKRFSDVVYLITGSFIVISLGVIMTLNFFKDGRIFEQTVATAVQDTSLKAPSGKDGTKTDSFETVKYQRPADAPVDKTDYGESIPKTQTPKDSTAVKEKIKVEVINYSGIKKLAEEIKSTLEASGYEVSAGNGKSGQPVRTAIIDRSGKNAAIGIQKILKAGVVTKSPDPKSRFDVTVNIGDDYKP